MQLAKMVAEIAGAKEAIEFLPPLVDNATVRCPDVTNARTWLGWEPTVALRDGLTRTVAWARDRRLGKRSRSASPAPKRRALRG